MISRVLLQEHLRQCLIRAEERVRWLLEIEQDPFTLNTHYYADYRDKFLAYYKGARERENNPTLMKEIDNFNPSSMATKKIKNGSEYAQAPLQGIAKILSGLTDVGVHGSKPQDISKILPADKMEPALTIMAEVRAYFQGKLPLAIDIQKVC